VAETVQDITKATYNAISAGIAPPPEPHPLPGYEWRACDCCGEWGHCFDAETDDDDPWPYWLSIRCARATARSELAVLDSIPADPTSLPVIFGINEQGEVYIESWEPHPPMLATSEVRESLGFGVDRG